MRNCYRRGSGEIAMRRLFTLTVFGFGFYYLWYNNDTTLEMIAVGMMGLALLIEFAAAD
jgi:hypothetical protein